MSPVGDSLRPVRAGYFFGGFNGLTWIVSLGTPMVLLLERLGGSSVQVGLASSMLFLVIPVQVLATATLERLGFRRQMILAWTARAMFLSIPLGLAWLAPRAPEPWMANALVFGVFCFCLCRAVGIAAHLPWFAAILPDALRGRYWATEGAIVSAVGVAALLLCSALFANLPDFSAFRWAYGIALFGSCMSVYCLLQLPPGPRPAPSPIRDMAGAAVRLCVGPGLFRHYLMFALLGAVVNTSFGAFASYYLKAEVGLASSSILSFTAMTFAGQIIGTWTIRRWIDVLPIRVLFQLANGIFGAVFLFWLGVVLHHTPSNPAFMVAYLAFGVASGIANVTHMTFLPEVSAAAMRPIALAVFGAISGVFSGLGPVCWGIALRTPGAQPGVDLDNFALFFGLGAAICALVVVLLRWLPDPRARA